MTLPKPPLKFVRHAATLLSIAALATAGATVRSAGSAPIRLLGVSAQGNAVLIESSEPVAYAVRQPDPLTVLVELRGVSVADAANQVARRDPVTSVTLEQTEAIDGRAVARVRIALARPSDYAVRSARNTIRLELKPAAGKPVAAVPPLPVAAETTEAAPPARLATSVAATAIDRVRTTRNAESTIVTVSGNGRLTPASVTESRDLPRQLLLDFPQVSSTAAGAPTLNDTLVKRVQIVNGWQPGGTRVAIELAAGSTYHIERAGPGEQDLAVVVEPSRAPATVMIAPSSVAAPLQEREADIPLHQAIVNVASITGVDAARSDPVTALRTAPATARAAAAAPATFVAPAPAPRVSQAAQPPAPAPPLSSLQQPQSGERRYTGAPISLDFVGADLRSVLREFAGISGLNIIIDPGVPSTPIDIQLKDIPWDHAFETLLRTHQLGYEADGTIIRIAPLKVFEDEQRQRSTLAAAKALAGDLQVKTYSLSYAKALEMQPLLVKSALSARGEIQVDTRTNTLIITDLPDRLQTASNLILTLDRPEPQVEVEARVVQTTRDFAKAIGVQWGLNGRVNSAIGNTTPFAFPNNGSLGGRTGGNNLPNDLSRATGLDNTATAINLPIQGASTAIGLALGAVNGAFNLDVALSALERSGKGRVLSTPRLTTQNNIEAEVAQGVQIPIQTVANNTVTVTFRDAVLRLLVTPQITSANTVIMKITVENATPDFSRQINGTPPINTQRANTQVQVNDGATTIIGGIFVSTETSSSDKVPMLHRLPLLGWLFKRDQAADESRELLIFITPRILRG